MKCCAMISKTKRCQKKATFEIMDATRGDPDNFTHACESHVGELLGSVEGYPVTTSWNVHTL